MYSAQLSQTSEVTITTIRNGLPTVHESQDPDSSPPDYYQLYTKPTSSSDVTATASSLSSEEKEQLSASPEIEKQPLPSDKAADNNGSTPQSRDNGNNTEAAGNNGSPPQLQNTSNNTPVLEHASDNQPNPTLEHNGSLSLQVYTSDDTRDYTMQNGDHMMPNGDHVTNRETLNVNATDQSVNSSNGEAIAATANNTTHEKGCEKNSPGAKRKGLKKFFFIREKTRTNSQKPLLNSQTSTSTTPGDRYVYIPFTVSIVVVQFYL